MSELESAMTPRVFTEAEEWTRVNQVMELVKQEGDARCEAAFDFLLQSLRLAREQAVLAMTLQQENIMLRERNGPLIARAEGAEKALRKIESLTNDPVDKHEILWTVIIDCHQAAADALGEPA